MKKITIILTFYAIILLACSPKPSIPIPELKKQQLKSLIMILEKDPFIMEAQRDVVVWALQQKHFTLVLHLPVPFDTSYHKISLFNAYISGILLYVFDNWDNYKPDKNSIIDFNLKAYMSGMLEMIKWYKSGVKIKGDIIKNSVMENLIQRVEDGELFEIAKKYVYDIVDTRGDDVIIIYIHK